MVPHIPLDCYLFLCRSPQSPSLQKSHTQFGIKPGSVHLSQAAIRSRVRPTPLHHDRQSRSVIRLGLGMGGALWIGTVFAKDQRLTMANQAPWRRSLLGA